MINIKPIVNLFCCTYLLFFSPLSWAAKGQNTGLQETSAAEIKRMVEYVTHSLPTRAQWRSNPQDPYIYISFSTRQYVDAYGTDPGAIFILKMQGEAVDFKDEIKNQIIDLLDEEWGRKTKVPYKYLDEDSSPESVRSKNIWFIFSVPLSEEERYKVLGNAPIVTLPLTFPLDMNFATVVPAQFKITKFPSYNKLDNEDRHIILHESAHALIELKHFRPYDKTDLPPHSDVMTCLDSVMSYKDTCPPVLDAEAKLLGPKQINRFDPTMQNIMNSILDAYPVTLGPVDIQAAHEFTKSWKKRNKNTTKGTVNKKVKNEEHEYACSDANNYECLPGTHVSNPIFFGVVDRCINYLADYAKYVVEGCPSYFPPHNVQGYYWNNTQPADACGCSSTTIACSSQLLLPSSGQQ